MTAADHPRNSVVHHHISADEWYPRECWLCEWAAALACSDSYCRGRRFGEHRDGCPAPRDSLTGCTCLGEVEPQ